MSFFPKFPTGFGFLMTFMRRYSFHSHSHSPGFGFLMTFMRRYSSHSHSPGFGFLMTFMRRYSFSSVSFNFVLAVITIQYAILVNGFFHGVMEGDGLHKVLLSRCTPTFSSQHCTSHT